MQILKVINYISNWLINYLNKNKKQGFIIGISGGIDSAVTSTILAKTKYPLLTIEMPINQLNKEYLTCSKDQINFLKKKFNNVKSLKIDLSILFNQFCKIVNYNKSLNNELSIINVKPRLRMILLYYYASIYNSLVVGTGNKIEDFGVGFFTKYGDGGVDINPIGDLNKSQIFDIAKYLNIPDSIQQAPPTDGLWEDNRSDKDQLGLSYKELEIAMNILENKKNINLLSKKEYLLYNKYIKFHKTNKHKMRPIPICKIPKYLK